MEMTRPEIIAGPRTLLDGGRKELIWRLRCPRCGAVAIADIDQMRGRVSLQCEAEGECDYHETHELIDEDFRPIVQGGNEWG